MRYLKIAPDKSSPFSALVVREGMRSETVILGDVASVEEWHAMFHENTNSVGISHSNAFTADPSVSIKATSFILSSCYHPPPPPPAPHTKQL